MSEAPEAGTTLTTPGGEPSARGAAGRPQPAKEVHGRGRAAAIVGARDFGLAVVVAIAFLALSLTNDHFLTQGNLAATAVGFTPLLIVSIGMTVALISGGFDLSVGGIVSLTAVCLIYLMNQGMGFFTSLVATLIAAFAIGTLNGLLISKVKINPLITTLGTMGIARGAAEVLSQGTIVAPKNPEEIPTWLIDLGTKDIGGVPILLAVPLVVLVIGEILLRRGRFFREIFFLGGSERAARFVGIRVGRAQMAVYMLTAGLSALAGLMLVARFQSATATYGTGYELQALAAAVIGGAALSGGVGSLTGTFLATLLLALVQDAIVLYSVSVYWQDLITGAILVIAVAVTLHGRQGGALRQLLGFVVGDRRKGAAVPEEEAP